LIPLRLRNSPYATLSIAIVHKSKASAATNKGCSFPRIPQSRLPAYLRVIDNAGYWRAMCYRHNTYFAPIVAGNVIPAPHRTARMASRQIMNPMRRAIAQRARPTSARVCFQCQRRWQSKVSQRPGSDRYDGNQQRCSARNWLTVM
jgi:hypothetical protein